MVWAPEATGPAETPSSAGLVSAEAWVLGVYLPNQIPSGGGPMGEAKVLSGVFTPDPLSLPLISIVFFPVCLRN